VAYRHRNSKSEARNPKQLPNFQRAKSETGFRFDNFLSFDDPNLFRVSKFGFRKLPLRELRIVGRPLRLPGLLRQAMRLPYIF
jgi:hypothetical protein